MVLLEDDMAGAESGIGVGEGMKVGY